MGRGAGWEAVVKGGVMLSGLARVGTEEAMGLEGSVEGTGGMTGLEGREGRKAWVDTEVGVVVGWGRWADLGRTGAASVGFGGLGTMTPQGRLARRR